MNIMPSVVIFTSNRRNPNMVMGTRLVEPTMAYVLAEVDATHHNDVKLRTNPPTAATIFIMKKLEFIISVLNNAATSPRKMHIGNKRNNDRRLL
jgi:hypothetical protein